MKHFLNQLNKAFENRVRLGIMSILVVNDKVAYTRLKELLGTSDGNLASHLKHLEGKNYIRFEKRFEGRKPLTVYQASPEGKKAFEEHISAIENLLNSKYE